VAYEVTTQWSYDTGQTRSSTVLRRFRDFSWLHNELTAAGPVNFELPSRHWLGNLSESYTDEHLIDERRLHLEGYLKGLVVVHEFWQSRAMQVFLGATASTLACCQLESKLDSVERYMNQPVSFNLDDDIVKAAYSLHNIIETMDIDELFAGGTLDNCAGIAFLTMAKGGFMFSGRVGTGLVIARIPNGEWSAPSAIGAFGAGWGMQMGGEVTDAVIVLSDKDAVDTFASSVFVGGGTELSLSMGPVGIAAETSVHLGDRGPVTSFSSAHGRGVFLGLSIQATVFMARHDINEAFYGKVVSTHELLDGRYPRPAKVAPLYDALSVVFDNRRTRQTRSLRAFNNEELYPIESLRPPPAVPASSRQFSTSEVTFSFRQDPGFPTRGDVPAKTQATVSALGSTEDCSTASHEEDDPPPVAVAVGVVAVALASTR